jgi:hypothetical protein
MKQDQSWMSELTPLLRAKKNRVKDVFGNPLPTAYEAINYPKAIEAWLKTREPFLKPHPTQEHPTCNQCLINDHKCTYPKCPASHPS